jgi:uncharacterized protein (DUF2235 family)
MKKRIVICCDGTWNRLGGARPTNVTRLTRALLPHGPDGTVQAIVHVDGVGAGRGTGAIAQAIDRAFGGAFGSGLNDRIREAYRFLVLNYRPGDEIYVFGYSRGAYTARALVGLIRNCGVLERPHAGLIEAAMTLYRRPGADPGPGEKRKPDDPNSLTFRAAYSAHVTTGAGELDWRRARGYPEPDTAPVPLAVHYIGVWDTVGQLGIPSGLSLASLVNRGKRFHDTNLSSTVHAARHAVAIDENRANFGPTTWDNIADFADTRRHFEAWFPGDHGSVGGGGEVTGLSTGALLWVLEGAMELGLAVDAGALDEWRREVAFDAPLYASGASPSWFSRAIGGRMRPRRGPSAFGGVSRPARRRWRADTGYRPHPLSHLAADLDRFEEEADA